MQESVTFANDFVLYSKMLLASHNNIDSLQNQFAALSETTPSIGKIQVRERQDRVFSMQALITFMPHNGLHPLAL